MTKERTSMEQWKAIAGYDGQYEVSNLGRVRSLKSGKEKILRPNKNNNGYLLVYPYKDGKTRGLLIHRLVAEAFIPNPQGLETVNHKDEVKTNNSVDNLEWMSRKDNINYGSRNKCAGKAISKININNPAFSKQVQMFDKSTGELLATFPSTHEAGRVTGIASQHIGECCRGKHKSSGGYVWRYT